MAHPLLQARLNQLTLDFVRELLGLFREGFAKAAGVARSSAREGRTAAHRGRRSSAETAALAKRIASYVGKQTKGIRVEALGKALGLKTKEMALPIAKALKSKMIKKTGQRRATTYLPGGNRK